jgi:hypothetical protein
MFDDINSPGFIPADDMPEWMEATFLDPASPVHNPDHGHLRFAKVIAANPGIRHFASSSLTSPAISCYLR